ncbi:MAG: hypothetical protein RMJ96_08715, partial [Candidatus Bipolaricaulota bacterium]|nr:hypothetical protein [Candidatus Bipolaricaulota bacterium]
ARHVFPWHCLVCCKNLGFSSIKPKPQLPPYVRQRRVLREQRQDGQEDRTPSASPPGGADGGEPEQRQDERADWPSILVIWETGRDGFGGGVEGDDWNITTGATITSVDPGSGGGAEEDDWDIYLLGETNNASAEG